MSGYDKFMAPLEKRYLAQIRAEIMPKAHGQVLEIAFASGVNMKYYDFDKIDSFHALDVNQGMKKFERVNYHVFSAEKLPFEDETFDTVVLILALINPLWKRLARGCQLILVASTGTLNSV